MFEKSRNLARQAYDVIDNKTGAVLQTVAYVGTGVMVMASGANAALDFTAITAAIDATTIVAAISAIAAIRILPGVAKWGYGKVLSWFR